MATVLGCARCQTPLKGPSDPKPNDTFACPSCGESDSLDNVKREVGEFVQEQAQQAFDDILRNTFKGSETITITETLGPERTYRFVPIEDGH
ncbi:hypothetical protein SAMN05519104_5187 [Rhizobiales bacterium GAS188]|nr:hypothetical protein SAMN05519104_5187 [Rhizobiales bacterium GAS188]